MLCFVAYQTSNKKNRQNIGLHNDGSIPMMKDVFTNCFSIIHQLSPQ